MSNTNLREEREGQTFVSNEGCKFFVKEYVSSNNVIVKFCDGHKAEVPTTWQQCTKGQVKNPYFKSVYGVACLGVGDFVTSVNGKLTREYDLWKQMIRRCYSGEYSSYTNVIVCERWLVYANFLEDLSSIENYQMWLENPNQRISLDKDIKQQDVENKVYSLETVKFVTNVENTKEVHERKRNKR